MAIVRAPLKTAAAIKCSRRRVIIFNPGTHKQEWHTVNGTRREAEAFRRQQKTRLASGRLHRQDRSAHLRRGRRDVPERACGSRSAHQHPCVLSDGLQVPLAT